MSLELEREDAPFLKDRQKVAVKVRALNKFSSPRNRQQVHDRFVEHKRHRMYQGEWGDHSLLEDFERVFYHNDIEFYSPYKAVFYSRSFLETQVNSMSFKSYIDNVDYRSFLEVLCRANENGMTENRSLYFGYLYIIEAYLDGYDAIEKYIELQDYHGWIRHNLLNQQYQHRDYISEKLLEDLQEATKLADQLFPKDIAKFHPFTK